MHLSYHSEICDDEIVVEFATCNTSKIMWVLNNDLKNVTLYHLVIYL